MHFHLHRELQVNFGWKWILSTQRVDGGVVCIFIYTESCKLTGGGICISPTQRVGRAGWGAILKKMAISFR